MLFDIIFTFICAKFVLTETFLWKDQGHLESFSIETKAMRNSQVFANHPKFC